MQKIYERFFEINIRNFVKVQFGEGPTFSSVCTAKCLAEVFVFQLLPVHPSVSVREKTLSSETPNPQQTRLQKFKRFKIFITDIIKWSKLIKHSNCHLAFGVYPSTLSCA